MYVSPFRSLRPYWITAFNILFSRRLAYYSSSSPLNIFSNPAVAVHHYELVSIGGGSTLPMLFFPAAGATSQKTFSAGPINA